MNACKRILLPVLVMTVVAMITTGAALTILYNTLFEEQQARLTETAKNQARLIEAMARFDARISQYDHPEGAAAARSDVKRKVGR